MTRKISFAYLSVFGSRMMSSTITGQGPTAGILVIGDEILKGYTVDTNSHFLCRRLFNIGVKVEKISVIPDDIDVISNSVAEFSRHYTHVITSGGVGPTHDDKTFAGIARAFGDSLALNETLSGLVRKYFKLENKEISEIRGLPAFKLAEIPSTAKLIWGIHKETGKQVPYPVVQVRNVTVFPGIPKLMQRAFDMIEDHFKPKVGKETKFYSYETFVNTDEVSIARVLSEISSRFEPAGVNIGSYPKIDHSYYTVKVTVDGTEDNLVKAARDEVRALLAGHVIPYDRNPLDRSLDKFDKYLSQLESSDLTFHELITDSMQLVENILEKHKLKKICLFFNGGKDCTVLLHMVHLCLCRKFGQNYAEMLKTVYVTPQSVFPEQEQFVSDTQKRYSLDLVTLSGPIKQALYTLQTIHPAVEVVYMGTRRSDPNSHLLQPVAMTDPDWPKFLRISPLMSWDYGRVWQFLRDLWLPYCELYDKGYTSLGCRETTGPNMALKFIDRLGITRYQPAYKLADYSLERHGRNATKI